MKKLVIALTAVVLLLGAISCTRAAERGLTPVPTPEGQKALYSGFTTPTPVPMPTPAPVQGPAPMPTGRAEADVTWATERMIVRTGGMSLVVEDIPHVIDQITRLAEASGGYVVSSRSWREGDRLRGTITIRVPARDFASVMESLGELAVEVVSQSTSSKDVTEEYVDLSAKLQNLQATEQQLLKIMEKAEKVEDILNVQRELSRTRGEIEQTKGRMQYLERTSATSLIEVRLEQAKLEAKFTADKRFVRTGEEVRFASQVVGGFAPYSYQWDFGDGKTSTSIAPTHEYRSSGSYTVTLKVTDDRDNTDTEETKDYITVLPGWSAGNIASNAWNGLTFFARLLADIFIWAGIFSPVWIVVGGIVYLVYWWRRRKKRA